MNIQSLMCNAYFSEPCLSLHKLQVKQSYDVKHLSKRFGVYSYFPSPLGTTRNVASMNELVTALVQTSLTLTVSPLTMVNGVMYDGL